MRRTFVAGNWKMNLDQAAATTLATALSDKLNASPARQNVDVAVCPSFVYLPPVAQALKGSNIALGAQDVYFQPNGAFTGEVSVAMLKDVCCTYVIVGHSERRHVIGEDDLLTNKKLLAALAAGLKPILCIGELLEEREKNQTETVLERHLRNGLLNVAPERMTNVTIAYEPVWAIGTGKTATPDQAQQAHAFARTILKDIFGPSVAEATRIQYGGSVKADNAAELLSQNDVDGALVGGASLKVDDFLAIIEAGDHNTGPCKGCCGCNAH